MPLAIHIQQDEDSPATAREELVNGNDWLQQSDDAHLPRSHSQLSFGRTPSSPTRQVSFLADVADAGPLRSLSTSPTGPLRSHSASPIGGLRSQSASPISPHSPHSPDGSFRAKKTFQAAALHHAPRMLLPMTAGNAWLAVLQPESPKHLGAITGNLGLDITPMAGYISRGSSFIASPGTSSMRQHSMQMAEEGPRSGLAALAQAVNAEAKARWHRTGSVFAGIAKASNMAEGKRKEFLAMNEKVAAEIKRGRMKVQLEVKSPEQLKTYDQQGSLGFYSSEGIQQRLAARSSLLLRDAVERWWLWLPHQQLSSSGVNAISKPAYCAMVVCLQMVLLPLFGMEGSEDYDPSEDWSRDSRGRKAVDFPLLLASLFDLADTWCGSVDPQEYAELLRKLLEGVQKLEAEHGTYSRLLARFTPPPPPPPVVKERKAKQGRTSTPPSRARTPPPTTPPPLPTATPPATMPPQLHPQPHPAPALSSSPPQPPRLPPRPELPPPSRERGPSRPATSSKDVSGATSTRANPTLRSISTKAPRPASRGDLGSGVAVKPHSMELDTAAAEPAGSAVLSREASRSGLGSRGMGSLGRGAVEMGDYEAGRKVNKFQAYMEEVQAKKEDEDEHRRRRKARKARRQARRDAAAAAGQLSSDASLTTSPRSVRRPTTAATEAEGPQPGSPKQSKKSRRHRHRSSKKSAKSGLEAAQPNPAVPPPGAVLPPAAGTRWASSKAIRSALPAVALRTRRTTNSNSNSNTDSDPEQPSSRHVTRHVKATSLTSHHSTREFSAGRLEAEGSSYSQLPDESHPAHLFSFPSRNSAAPDSPRSLQSIRSRASWSSVRGPVTERGEHGQQDSSFQFPQVLPGGDREPVLGWQDEGQALGAEQQRHLHLGEMDTGPAAEAKWERFWSAVDGGEQEVDVVFEEDRPDIALENDPRFSLSSISEAAAFTGDRACGGWVGDEDSSDEEGPMLLSGGTSPLGWNDDDDHETSEGSQDGISDGSSGDDTWNARGDHWRYSGDGTASSSSTSDRPTLPKKAAGAKKKRAAFAGGSSDEDSSSGGGSSLDYSSDDSERGKQHSSLRQQQVNYWQFDCSMDSVVTVDDMFVEQAIRPARTPWVQATSPFVSPRMLVGCGRELGGKPGSPSCFSPCLTRASWPRASTSHHPSQWDPQRTEVDFRTGRSTADHRMSKTESTSPPSSSYTRLPPTGTFAQYVADMRQLAHSSGAHFPRTAERRPERFPPLQRVPVA